METKNEEEKDWRERERYKRKGVCLYFPTNNTPERVPDSLEENMGKGRREGQGEKTETKEE